MLVYAGANVRRGDAHRPVHAAAPRQPQPAALPAVKALLKARRQGRCRGPPRAASPPLHLAAASGNADVVTALLDAKADVNASESEWGQTPLMFAAAQNRVEAIKVLARARRRRRRHDQGRSTSPSTSALDRAAQPAVRQGARGLRPARRQSRRRARCRRRSRRAASSTPRARFPTREAGRAGRRAPRPRCGDWCRRWARRRAGRTADVLRGDARAVEQGRPDGAAARRASGLPGRRARAARRRRRRRTWSAPATARARC